MGIGLGTRNIAENKAGEASAFIGLTKSLMSEMGNEHNTEMKGNY